MTEPLHDVARIAHAELLTPKPEESLRFFVDVLGLEEEAREAGRLPARLGGLPAVQPEAHGVPAAGTRPRRPPRLEPVGARPAGRRD